MSKTIYNADYSECLPEALKKDPKMVALANATAATLLDTSGIIDNVLIYSRFDELPEELVDILAYDLHVDWYDYNYPLEAKRDLVKNSVKVHKKMGTKYAIETALGSLFPESEVEEWFHSVTCRDCDAACLPSGVPLWLLSGFYPSCWCICIAKRIQRRVCVDMRRLL